VRTVERSQTSASTVVTTYKATVIGLPQKAELHVQQTFKGNVIVPGKVPSGGLYMLVADATPVDKGRTRIDVYAPSMGAGEVMVRAIKGWATGENLGCPDLTKTS
jgi:hypothetical protein